ncbi:hypothetical protein AALB_0558 [Agarivorans albus MKT 106]|uniref:Uncharacterized protein n=1 Tax=Agarivorans albus MKT 106 TaxID=1331007 RepID=R9PGV9_AGAAL|nr:hypothetical protein AALB_0558 [Agarivorans albus MKT 106]
MYSLFTTLLVGESDVKGINALLWCSGLSSIVSLRSNNFGYGSRFWE